jgi:hypothetical protein
MSSADDPPDRTAEAQDMNRAWHDLLAAIALYLAFSAAGHAIWEVVQLPLYTIWTKGTFFENVFAILHCTVGDVLIAAWSLLAALVLHGLRGWPQGRRFSVPALAIIIASAYTGYSEWRNVYVIGAWAYTPAMPTLSIAGYGIGLTPMLQWLVVPAVAFALAFRARERSVSANQTT